MLDKDKTCYFGPLQHVGQFRMCLLLTWLIYAYTLLSYWQKIASNI